MNTFALKAAPLAIVLATASFTTFAKVSADEAAKLGASLTPVGAIKAGTDSGVAEWTPLKSAPAGYDGKDLLDPFAADKPLFTITKDNLAEHKDKLSEGHQKLFALYPEYKMNVYPSRRPVIYPKQINDATIANATTATLEGSDALANASLGFPFPIPAGDNAAEQALINHKVRYRGDNVTRNNDQVIVDSSGNQSITKVIEEAYFSYGNIKTPGDLAADNLVLLYLSEITAPAKTAGKFTLVSETANQDEKLGGKQRSAYIANKGSPRPRRAPNVSYDNPSDGTDGMQFNEQVDMYNGALDRYNWKMVGLKEMIIPYNGYKLAKTGLKYADMLPGKHLNQDLARYEMHRVWVTEADLKDGIRHSFRKRRTYQDEDSWGLVMVDLYDDRGELWRFQEGHQQFLYEIKGLDGSTGTGALTTPELIYDFNSGSYFATALANEGEPNRYNSEDLDPKYFTTSGLKRKLK